MDTKGGRFTIDIAGRRYSARGEASIMPAQATPTTGVNSDATGYVTVEPQLAEVEIKFDRGSFPWTERMLLATVNVTFKEKDANVTHLFTNANFSGRPTINTASGEVTGMKISTDVYRRI